MSHPRGRATTLPGEIERTNPIALGEMAEGVVLIDPRSQAEHGAWRMPSIWPGPVSKRGLVVALGASVGPCLHPLVLHALSK